MVPLYRYWKASISDHFYTTNSAEIGTGLAVGATGNYGYKYEGIQCYVFASAADALQKELNEHPVDEAKRDQDIKLFDNGIHDMMPFTPINENGLNFMNNWMIIAIAGIIGLVMAVIVGIVWYGARNRKDTGYQMLV